MPLTRRIATLGLLLMAASGSATISLPTSARAAQNSATTATTTEDICPAPTLNHVTCDARVVVSRKTHRVIHPKVTRKRTVRSAAFIGTSAPDKLTPLYLQQAYDLTSLSATQGAGDTVAIVGVFNAPHAASDLATFRSTYHLSACTTANGCFRQINEQGQSSPLPSYNSSWSQEEEMDLDAVSSLCPNCKIDLVEAASTSTQDLQAAIVEAISAGADQVSISATDLSTGDPFTNFAHTGVSIFAAAGDDGVIPTGQANYPAALPFVNAVGGTSLAPQSSTTPTARGIAESIWSASGSGCDTSQAPLTYQPSLGCDGRMYSDVSADADPTSGLMFYDAQAGGWLQGGGTSLAAPLAAAFAAVTGVDATTPQWAYTDAESLNDPTLDALANCDGQAFVSCSVVGDGYSGAAGAGSISGDIVSGAPGIGDPSYGDVDAKSYVVNVRNTSVKLAGGVYPNNEATEYYWQFGTTTAYGSRTTPVSAGSYTGVSAITDTITTLKPATTYHYRLVAVNASGTTNGYDYSFRTPGQVSSSTGLSMH